MIIIYETHSTTFDNEAGRASGWNDVDLSPQGEDQARELGKRYRLADFDMIYAADLKRTRRTVELAFPGIEPAKLRLDWRLRELDYGDLTLQPKGTVEAEKAKRINEPFPNGESYQQAISRVQSFLDDLKRESFQKVMIVDSRAVHHALDHLLKAKPLTEVVAEKLVWQPGWEYEI